MILDNLSRSIETSTQLLFKPFDILKWLKWGVIVFLVQLGSGGGYYGPRGGWSGGSSKHGKGMAETMHALLPFLIFLGIFAIAVAIVLWVAFTYLSSRGTFMYIHCVGKNSSQLGEAWRGYPKLSLSLFWWRILFALGSILAILITIGIPLLLFIPKLYHNRITGADIPFLVLAVILLVLVGGALTLIAAVVKDFIAPIMYKRDVGIMEAWKIAMPILTEKTWSLIGYYLLKIVLVIAVGAVLGTLVILTCCCLLLFLVIPVISQALTQPIHVFFRAWSLHILGDMDDSLTCIEPVEV